jgi:hypothetical protein
VRILFTVIYASGELRHEVHGTTDHAAWFDVSSLDNVNIADYALTAIHSAAK